jgi:hypothetical protein
LKTGIHSTGNDLPCYAIWPSGIAFDSKVTEGYYLDICADAEMYQLSIMRDKTQPRQVYVAIHTKLHVLKAVLSVVVSHSQLKFIERSQFEVPDRKTMEVLLAMLNVLPGHIAVRGYDPFYL